MSEKKWISKAVKRPSALHKELGVKEGKKIPAKKMAAAKKRAKKTDDTRLLRQINLAKTLKKMHKK